jgi:hypothetical protein
MTDTREQVARAMKAVDEDQFDGMHEIPLSTFGLYADAALAVATPLIRAQVVEELAQKAEQEHPDCLTPCDLNPVGDDWQLSLADWLRAQNT